MASPGNWERKISNHGLLKSIIKNAGLGYPQIGYYNLPHTSLQDVKRYLLKKAINANYNLFFAYNLFLNICDKKPFYVVSIIE